MAIHFAFQNSGRKNSYSDLRVGLDLGRLFTFLQQTMARFSTNPELTRSALAEINNVLNKDDLDDSCDSLENLMAILGEFVSSETRLPTTVVFESHSIIGTLQEHLRHHKLATQSFLRAIWIASSTDEILPVYLGLTLHRLAKSYGALNMHREARDLLSKALIKYSVLSKDHAVVLDAKELYCQYEKILLGDWQRHSSQRLPRLELIQENVALERRLSY